MGCKKKSKGHKGRSPEKGAEVLQRCMARIAAAIGHDWWRENYRGGVELVRVDKVAWGLETTVRVEIISGYHELETFRVRVSCSHANEDSPGDCLALSAILQKASERGALAQVIAREYGHEFTDDEIGIVTTKLREEKEARGAEILDRREAGKVG
jgi:hypothetical protein